MPPVAPSSAGALLSILRSYRLGALGQNRNRIVPSPETWPGSFWFSTTRLAPGCPPTPLAVAVMLGLAGFASNTLLLKLNAARTKSKPNARHLGCFPWSIVRSTDLISIDHLPYAQDHSESVFRVALSERIPIDSRQLPLSVQSEYSEFSLDFSIYLLYS